MKALVVDDSITIRAIVARCLAEQSVETLEAADGVEALQMLEQHEGIGLVVSDWRMPNLDGLGLLERVRANDPAMPFLLLTSDSTPEACAEARAAGVTAYLVKPVVATVLRRHIVEVLEATAGD